MPTLSIGMIVKNEEAILRETLEALRPLREAIDVELIIADTGSDDATPEIAREYADKFFSIEWEHDFSKARNATLRSATGRWFFYLDADEVLTDPDELIAFFNSNKSKRYNSVGVRIRSILSVQGGSWNEFWSNRIFRRSSGQKFTGAVHEQVLVELPTLQLMQTFLHHMGYNNDDTVLMKRKTLRNIELLENEYEKEKNPTKKCKLLLEMMDSFGLDPDQIENAERKAREAIVSLAFIPQKSKAAIYYAAKAYSGLLRNLNGQRRFLEGIELGKKYLMDRPVEGVQDSDIYFALGNAMFVLDNYQEAIFYLEKYLELINLDKIELSSYFVLCTSAYQGLARYWIAQSSMNLQDDERAWNILHGEEQRYVQGRDLFACKLQVALFKDMDKRLPDFYPQLVDEDDLLQLLNASLQTVMYSFKGDDLQALQRTLRNLSPEPYLRQLLLCCTDDFSEFNQLLAELPNEPFPAELGILVYQACRFRVPFSELQGKLDLSLIEDYLAVCAKHRPDFAEQVLGYCQHILPQTMNQQELFMMRVIFSYLTFYADAAEEQLIPLWETMLVYADLYAVTVYQPQVWREELLYLLPTIDRFVYYSQQAQTARLQKDYVTCLQYLRQGLGQFTPATRVVDMLKQEAEKQLATPDEVQDEMAMLAVQVKAQIRQMIDQQQLIQAAAILQQLKALVPNDPELEELETLVQQPMDYLN